MCEPTWARGYMEEGYVMAGTHNCYTCIPALKFIEEKMKQELKNNLLCTKESEIADMKKQIEHHKKQIEELKQEIVTKEQYIDHLNTSTIDLQERIETIENTHGDHGDPKRGHKAMGSTTTQGQGQRCEIVELKFRSQEPQFRIKWRRCNTTTLQNARDIAEHFPEETRTFLLQMRKNNPKQIEILNKHEIKELLDLLYK